MSDEKGDPPGAKAHVSEVFLRAAALDVTLRRAFLDDACGSNSNLRAEVEALLRHDVPTGALTSLVRDSAIPRAIGPYKPLEVLGEGGMGIVYLAEQTEPVRRRVALKIIKHGMNTKQVIARFDAERQALALMDHRSIARIYDAGSTPDGLPYFAMEYIQGIPITEHCDRHKLTTVQRLELVLQVCEGVQHAHQKTVIHRDLKPSNVLVSLQDGEPFVKIIDFGVAKALAQRLTEQSVYTEFGLMIGTPEYMSPEQAEWTSHDVDIRTDVYSLGVLLYELLVGALPLGSTALRQAGYDEIRRRIREEEPPRPSERVTSLGDGAKRIAADRSTDPSSLARRLRGELDWIVMMALEKDRARRYPSVSALGSDIANVLRNEPIAARPPSAVYRLRKFVSRHRFGVSAGSVVILALASGLVATTLMYRKAQKIGYEATESASKYRAQWILTAASRALQADPLRAALLLLELRDQAEPLGGTSIAASIARERLPRVILRGTDIRVALFSPDSTKVMTGSYDGAVRIWESDGSGEPIVLHGHTKSISSACFSHDGKSIATSSADGTARIWRSYGTGQAIVLRQPGEGIAIACFSPDGTRIVTSTADGTARVSRSDGIGDSIVLLGHTKHIRSATFSNDGLRIVTASEDGTARVWRSDGTGQPVVLKGHAGGLSTASFCHDGASVVTASEDGTARVWRSDGTDKPVVLVGHSSAVSSAQFSPDCARIVTASLDHTVRMWYADGAGEALVLEGDAPFVGASFSPDGTEVVAASLDGTARTWHAAGGGEVLRGHSGMLMAARYSPDGASIMTASQDGTARLWRAGVVGEPAVLHGHSKWVRMARFSPDGTRVVTASKDGTARVWFADGSGESAVLCGHTEGVNDASFSPDGGRIVTTSGGGGARIWFSDGGGEPIVLRGSEHVYEAAFSPDGTKILAASLDGASVWPADGIGEAVVLRGHSHGPLQAAFSPDGMRVVTASRDGTARVWRADATGEPIVLCGHAGAVRSAAFSSDGEFVVTASSDGTALIWRADGTGEPVILSGHQDGVNDAQFNPDGTSVVTAGRDGTVRIWRADGAGEPVVLRCGSGGVIRVASFSPDGNRIVATSSDEAACVWRSDGVGEPVVLSGHAGEVWYATFSPDGRKVVTASDDGTARVWRVSWEDLLEYLDSATTACLTPEERSGLLAESPQEAQAGHASCVQRHLTARAPKSEAR